MLADKMTLISGIIIFYLISSTSCNSSEEIKAKETEIEVLVGHMKKFLSRLSNLDYYLIRPMSCFELYKVETHHFFGKYPIKYKNSISNLIFKHFREEYKKFAEISKRCIKDYLEEINKMAPYPAGYLATKEERDAFVKFTDEDFKKQMSLKGDEDAEVVKAYEELQDEINILRNRINDMQDSPHPAPKVWKEEHDERSSSSSSSESDEEKSKKKEEKEKKEKENYGEHHGYKEGKASHSSESKSHEDHDKAGLGTGLALGLGAGLATRIIAAEVMDNSGSGEKEVIDHPEPEAHEEVKELEEHKVVEQSSAKSASSSSAVEEEEARGNEEGREDRGGEEAD